MTQHDHRARFCIERPDGTEWTTGIICHACTTPPAPSAAPEDDSPDRVITLDPPDKYDHGKFAKISAWWRGSHNRSSATYTRNELQSIVDQAADKFGIRAASSGRIAADDGTRVYHDAFEETPTRELTAADLEALRSRLDAYYYSFEETGVQVIDDLLHAVAWAGKASHHTSDWRDELWLTSYGPLRKGENWIALIQSLARDGADAIRRAVL